MPSGAQIPCNPIQACGFRFNERNKLGEKQNKTKEKVTEEKGTKLTAVMTRSQV